MFAHGFTDDSSERVCKKLKRTETQLYFQSTNHRTKRIETVTTENWILVGAVARNKFGTVFRCVCVCAYPDVNCVASILWSERSFFSVVAPNHDWWSDEVNNTISIFFPPHSKIKCHYKLKTWRVDVLLLCALAFCLTFQSRLFFRCLTEFLLLFLLAGHGTNELPCARARTSVCPSENIFTDDRPNY